MGWFFCCSWVRDSHKTFMPRSHKKCHNGQRSRGFYLKTIRGKLLPYIFFEYIDDNNLFCAGCKNERLISINKGRICQWLRSLHGSWIMLCFYNIWPGNCFTDKSDFLLKFLLPLHFLQKLCIKNGVQVGVLAAQVLFSTSENFWSLTRWLWWAWELI